MPSLLTHAFFADDFYAKHRSDKTFLVKNPGAFRLGSQGPDPLFFYGLWPKRGIKISICKEAFGSQLHRLDGEKLFTAMVEQLNSIENPEEKDVFASFALGQFAHYMLDSNSHAFVYYWSGFDKDGKLSGKYFYRHAHYEATIDSVLANARDRKELTSKPQNVLMVPNEKLEIINKNFVKVLEEVFSKELPKDLYKDSVNNMIDIYHFTNGGTCLRHVLFGHSSAGQLYIPTNGNHKVMNEDKNEWKHISTGEVHSEAFMDLFNRGQDDLELAFSNIKADGFKMESLKPVMKGLNYSGVPLGGTIKYKDVTDLLYPKGNK